MYFIEVLLYSTGETHLMAEYDFYKKCNDWFLDLEVERIFHICQQAVPEKKLWELREREQRKQYCLTPFSNFNKWWKSSLQTLKVICHLLFLCFVASLNKISSYKRQNLHAARQTSHTSCLHATFAKSAQSIILPKKKHK